MWSEQLLGLSPIMTRLVQGPRFVAKELGAVEVDPSASHQHEFHAGRVRNVLGFTAKTSGRLVIVLYDHANQPLISETEYTLYDAREGTKRTEWRLYYKSNLVADHAVAGDFLL